MLFRKKISLLCAFLMLFILNMTALSSFCFSQSSVNKTVKKEVNGEVFIVTKGAINVKLGLVPVYFLTEKQFKIASDDNNPHYLYAIDFYNNKESVQNYEHYTSAYNTAIKNVDFYKNLAQKYRDLEKKYNVDEKEAINNYENIAKESEANSKIYSEMAHRFIRTRYDLRAEIFSIQCFVDSVKQEVINDKTNADGKFKIELKNQKYWVFANSNRQVSNDSEEYHWLFLYTPDGKNLLLSNDNMK